MHTLNLNFLLTFALLPFTKINSRAFPFPDPGDEFGIEPRAAAAPAATTTGTILTNLVNGGGNNVPSTASTSGQVRRVINNLPSPTARSAKVLQPANTASGPHPVASICDAAANRNQQTWKDDKIGEWPANQYVDLVDLD